MFTKRNGRHARHGWLSLMLALWLLPLILSSGRGRHRRTFPNGRVVLKTRKTDSGSWTTLLQ